VFFVVGRLQRRLRVKQRLFGTDELCRQHLSPQAPRTGVREQR
jgi:hypothetical protein